MEEAASIFEKKELGETALATMKDPTRIVLTGIKHKCENCGKPLGEIRLKLEELILPFSQGKSTVQCPHCGANISKNIEVKESDGREMLEWLTSPDKISSKRRAKSNKVRVPVKSPSTAS